MPLTLKQSTRETRRYLMTETSRRRGANQLWVADITYVPTVVEFFYLVVVLDVWSRRIVGSAMENHLRTELMLAALDMAITRRRPTGVVHDSDPGCQYTSLAFGC